MLRGRGPGCSEGAGRCSCLCPVAAVTEAKAYRKLGANRQPTLSGKCAPQQELMLSVIPEAHWSVGPLS